MSVHYTYGTYQILEKVDEPVYLLIQNRDNEWIVEKEIKLRESKKQKGLVSFDLLHPVKRLMLIRTDGALTDDRNE